MLVPQAVAPFVKLKHTMQFPQHILCYNYSICHLKALNTVVACNMWAPKFSGKLLFTSSATVLPQLPYFKPEGEGTVSYKHVLERWAIWDVTLGVGHVAKEDLISSADAQPLVFMPVV